MFRCHKKVFAGPPLARTVPVIRSGADGYDSLLPGYLVWCDETRTCLYGGMRLMPTTGTYPPLRRLPRYLPQAANLVAPGIWEGTRMCIDEEAIAGDFPDVDAGRAFPCCCWRSARNSASITASTP